jgi:glycosyltransferase 2 family protein
MRKFIVALVLLLGVLLIITRFTEVQNIYATLQQGDWRFILLGLVTVALWMTNHGLSYQAVYRLLGIREKTWHMMKVAVAADFVNVVTPSGGMTTIAVFLDDARRRGHSSGRVMIAWALNLLIDYAAFLCVLTLGLGVLARRNDLHWTEITASCVLLFGALGLATLLYLGLRSGDALGNALAWIARLINRVAWPFIHRNYLEVERAHSFACEGAAGIAAVRQNPRGLLKPILLALSNKSLLILILILTFMAFRVPYSTGTIVAGFSIGYLFLIVSPTPSGIGIVEGVLTLALISLWVPVEAAAIITLVYRGYTFWLPLFVGMAAFRQIPHEKLKASFED